MAYMNQERKAKIAAALKPVLKKWHLSGTLRTDRYSITLTLRSGAVDFCNGSRGTVKPTGQEVNLYCIDQLFVPQVAACVREINAALRAADYYDRSDIRTDYFDTAYYYYLRVGADHARPYTVEGC